MPERFLVIGAGPTGLGAAIQLERNGVDWQLFEAEPHFGGLAASFQDPNGFTWDLGGHVQFSHYDEFTRWMDRATGPDGWYTHKRESWVHLNGNRIPYPLQNNLHRLPPAKRWECVQDILKAKDRREKNPRNFDEWASASLGESFNALFMRPYNFKVWGYPTTELDFNWIDERVSTPDLEKVLKSVCLNEDYAAWGPNHTFRYPKKGGLGAVWKSIGETLPAERVHLSLGVDSIDADKRILTSRDGREWPYDKIISSIPLDRLILAAPGVVAPETAKKLKFCSTNVVGVGIEGSPPEHLKTTCWMYFPGTAPFFRVTVFSNYSPNNVPKPGKQWSLMCEVCESERRPVNRNTIADDVVKSLRKEGLIIGNPKIASVYSHPVPYGYPVPFLNRNATVDPAREAFEKLGIYSRGRFGAWKYEVSNQDHSFMQGVEVVEHLVNGHAEQTLFNAGRINARLDNPFPYPEWNKTHLPNDEASSCTGA